MMTVTLLMFFLIFIPLSLFLWKFKIEQVTAFWQRTIGNNSDEEQDASKNEIKEKVNDYVV
jgi:hypothetical protein